ncbi:unnamed protein product (macronuclear) [Paramecium tetraurelia]|uniref:Protein kinase domain-containing protein n=1 Tax=Paramecium tetraurelia TaxID=5888 RepID=A0CA74_PARTE|nr:uncharacterized protein GSPATT00036471001 [Paramecium tetraurelia]CAK67691.1 unnamed protein product [Paramecium tetraurelia]|eukprot:XP_001435088.1 hypothetical protein (macronuclear) [Paramecium tetraurelia strain d4-2]
MGVCASKSDPKKVKKQKPQSVTIPPQQTLTTREHKTTTIQFQEPSTIQRGTTSLHRASPNQSITPIQKVSQNNVTTPVQRVSPSNHPTPKTMIIQSTQLQERSRNGSMLNIPQQRLSTKPGSKSIQSPASRNYSVVSRQNHKSQSKTVMQHNETGQLVLVEMIKFENRSQQFIDMLEELRLDQMNIVKILDIHMDSHKRNHQVVYEHCQGGHLSKFLDSNQLEYQTIGSMFYQMVEALAYVHSLGYSHDELTIDSFSVFDDSSTPFIKLSEIRSIYQFMYPKNSLLYEPPNSPNHHHHHKDYKDHSKPQNIQTKNRSQSNDIWALAIIVLQLLTHKFPFEIEEIHKFKAEEVYAEQEQDIYPLLIEMLHHNPNERITLEKCLLHPYLIKMKQVQPKDYIMPFTNIIKCKNMTYLHKCLFRYLLTLYASDHLKVLNKLFTTADLNKDGSLSEDELQPLLNEQPQEYSLQISDFVNITQEEFLLFAADKQQVLTQDCLTLSFKALSKSQNIITPKLICKVITDCNEEQLQQDFDTYNLNYTVKFTKISYQLQQKEYETFLINYQSPQPIV